MRSLRFAPVMLLLTVSTMFLASCASSPPPPSATQRVPAHSPAAMAPSSSEAATVYIYRRKAFVGGGLNPTVMLDGKDLVNIRNGRYFKAQFAPAKHNFQMDDGQSGAELDLKAGQEYYFRMDIVPGLWKGGGRLTLMVYEQGSFEIKGLKPVEVKEIEDPAFR